jgi:negative regulator of sigma E activity
VRIAIPVAAALALAGCAGNMPLPSGEDLIRQAHAGYGGTALQLEQSNVALQDGRPRYSYCRITTNAPDYVRTEVLAGDGVSRLSAPVVIVRDGRQSTVFSPGLGVARSSGLPAIGFGSGSQLDLLRRNYRAVTLAREKIAGRDAWLVELRPLHDGRPFTRVWLDVDTLAQLRQEEWGPEGHLLFVSQATTGPVAGRRAASETALPAAPGGRVRGVSADAALQVPRTSLAAVIGFTPGRLTYVPAGFAQSHPLLYTCPSSGTSCARWDLTDGRVSVSVYQTRSDGATTFGSARTHDLRGPVVAVRKGGYLVVVRGGLPDGELTRIARGVEPR